MVKRKGGSRNKTTSRSRSRRRRSSFVPGRGRYLDIIYNLNNSTGDISTSRSRRRKTYKKTYKKTHSVGDKPSKSFEHPGVSYKKILVQYNRLTPDEKKQLQDDFDNYVYGTAPSVSNTNPDLDKHVFMFKPKEKHPARETEKTPARETEIPFTQDDMIFINFLHMKYNTLDNIPKELKERLLDKDNGQEEINRILDSEEYKTFHADYYRLQNEEAAKHRKTVKRHVAWEDER
jgi:hypothetical protein